MRRLWIIACLFLCIASVRLWLVSRNVPFGAGYESDGVTLGAAVNHGWLRVAFRSKGDMPWGGGHWHSAEAAGSPPLTETPYFTFPDHGRGFWSVRLPLAAPLLAFALLTFWLWRRQCRCRPGGREGRH